MKAEHPALTEAIEHLTHKIHEALVLKKEELCWFQSHHGLATRNDLEQLLSKIMSAISSFTEKVNTKFDAISTSVDSIVTSQAGITDDVAALKLLIEQLQNNPGAITPEDQALLDAFEAKVNTMSEKVAGVSAGLKALDDATATPPTP